MYETKNKLRSTLLLGAATVAAMSMAGAAYAQEDVETVVVTGSHITSANLQSSAPILEATAEDISVRGTDKIEEYLNKLPQVFAGQNSNVSNGASGTATVDLRGLGCARTLVMVDGRRMPYGAPDAICVDLNQIPTSLVERVDVLSGGASAVYGSDAISGVVNFIMKKDFEGVQVDFKYSTYQHDNNYSGKGDIRSVLQSKIASDPTQYVMPNDSVWDGAGKDITVTMGASSPNGKANVTAYFTYHQNDQIMQGDRDYSECAITGQNTTTGQFKCGGSYTSAQGLFTDFSTFYYTLDQTTGDFVFGLPTYNYNPLNYFMRPDERYSFGAFGHYTINEHAEVYGQLMFMDDHTKAQIAPSGDFFNTSQINCDNPLLSAQQSAAIGCTSAMIANGDYTTLYIGRRNVEGGGRVDDLRHTSYRAVLGVKGSLSDGWTYDLAGSFSRVLMNEVYQNDFSISRMNKALDVVSDPSTGDAVCKSVLDGTDPNCVPYNIFAVGGVTQEALDYLQVPLFSNGSTTQLNLSLVVSGDLGQYGVISPWAKSGVMLAFGMEYRQDSLDMKYDKSYMDGDGAGQGTSAGIFPTSGAVHVAEGFVEASIPVIEGKEFAESVNLELAYRFSSYDYVDTNTYKVALGWVPVSSLRIRGSYDRAVRAPSVLELYTTQYITLFDMDEDPCGAGGYATLEQCQRTPGAGSASWYGSTGLNNSADQYNYLRGGNTDLKPEKADTFTYGFVFTPESIPSLSVSVDYFDIRVYNMISVVDPSNTLELCYLQNNTSACEAIHRNTNGSLWIEGGYVDALNTNIGGLSTSGIDFKATYQMVLDDVGLTNGGALSFDLTGTWLNRYTENTGLGIINKCVSEYGDTCGWPNPAWRHNFRINWEAPWYDISTTFTWRFYSGVHRDDGYTTAIDYHLPAQSYFDLSASMPVYDNATLRMGVSNLLDSDPPISTLGANGNTFPSVYDAMGRYLFASIRVKM